MAPARFHLISLVPRGLNMTPSLTRHRSDHRTLPLRIAAAALLTPLLLGACSADEADEPDFEQEFYVELEQTIEAAREGGASQEQLESLEQARETGEITLESVRTAAHKTAACLTNLGWNAEFEETVDADGLVNPSVTVTVPTAEADRDPTGALDECEFAHMFWLKKEYQTQPSSIELSRAFIREREPELRACLEENGHPVEVDASLDEVLKKESELVEETAGVKSCATEVGIEGY